MSPSPRGCIPSEMARLSEVRATASLCISHNIGSDMELPRAREFPIKNTGLFVCTDKGKPPFGEWREKVWASAVP